MVGNRLERLISIIRPTKYVSGAKGINSACGPPVIGRLGAQSNLVALPFWPILVHEFPLGQAPRPRRPSRENTF